MSWDSSARLGRLVLGLSVVCTVRNAGWIEMERIKEKEKEERRKGGIRNEAELYENEIRID
jgi:hypothetical protein